MMNKKVSVILVLITVLMIFSGCKKSESTADKFEVKSGDVFLVKVSTAESGAIKSMALTLYFDDNAFELIDGEWLGHDAVIADFNKENKDAAIAFGEDTNYFGEVFEFSVKAKKDLIIIDDMFIAEAVLKNEQETIECKGITLSYTKK